MVQFGTLYISSSLQGFEIKKSNIKPLSSSYGLLYSVKIAGGRKLRSWGQTEHFMRSEAKNEYVVKGFESEIELLSQLTLAWVLGVHVHKV